MEKGLVQRALAMVFESLLGDGINRVVTRGAEHTSTAVLGKLQGRVTDGALDAQLVLRYQEHIHDGRKNQRNDCDRNDTERSGPISGDKHVAQENRNHNEPERL